jgi:hypothetical protein
LPAVHALAPSVGAGVWVQRRGVAAMAGIALRQGDICGNGVIYCT